MTKRGKGGIIIIVVRRESKRQRAILENDIVKKRQTRKNSQISERDNGLTGSGSGTEDCEGLNIRV